ncbi:MAG: GntR family transcriptional regulator [Nitriliruptoraceae bacterium]
MSAAGEHHHGARPLWQQVLDDLERRITAGDIVDRFPTDKELTEQYGVSRHTVREAVRRLRARGLVDRQRGRGSFLTDAVLVQPLGGLYSLFRAVEEAGLEQRSEVLFRGTEQRARAAARLELPPDATLVRIERLRFAGGEPLAVDDTWLPEDLGRPLLEADLTRAALYDLLFELTDVRFTAAEEQLTPIVPDDDLIATLHLDAHEGVLQVDRLAWAGERPVECRTTLIRGQRFRYVSNWRSGDATPPTSAFVAVPEPH